MSLPVLGYLEVIKALQKRGFRPVRQSGSHIIVKSGDGLEASIPRKKELGRGLLLSIIADCEMTKREFMELL